MGEQEGGVRERGQNVCGREKVCVNERDRKRE